MIKGTVIFKLTNVGTKSQSEQPFLRVQEGVEFRIMVKGDNPFMHDLLRPYENKEVDIDGKFNERKVFIITNITELVIEPAEEPTAEAAAEPQPEEATVMEAKVEEIPEETVENAEEVAENAEESDEGEENSDKE